MRPHETSGNRLQTGSLTYEPDPDGFWGGIIRIDLPVDAPAPREHLVEAATGQPVVKQGQVQPESWDDEWSREWVDEQLERVERCIDKVANNHLSNATGSRALIRLSGERITAYVPLPAPLTDREQSPTPETSRSSYGGVPPLPPRTYLSYSKTRSLTPDQEAILPRVAESVRDVVPPTLQSYVDDIAHLVAQEIPTQSDLLRAYQRTSIPEVLAEYDRAGRPKQLPPEHQQAMKTAQLSFPSHAAEALKTSAPAVAVTPASAASDITAAHTLDR
ncbi:hypothetical protein LR392_11310 [Arthrobacter sp. AK04]|uniref:hypothetical protein n=1 Tax=Arthrobacter sp. AK04 TaxID=2900048 RepID=UPI001E33315E|nr:hypothetical protein [Arthrobacter sp. AK04]MCD5342808.1 hypothetical protein [Arthrobacter sp. AK04]